MIFLKKAYIGLQAVHKVIPKLLVAQFFRDPAVVGEDAIGIGVRHKRRLFGCIEDDTIGGFGSNPSQPQQLVAKVIHVLFQPTVELAF
jgi:hypothetical protein